MTVNVIKKRVNIKKHKTSVHLDVCQDFFTKMETSSSPDEGQQISTHAGRCWAFSSEDSLACQTAL